MCWKLFDNRLALSPKESSGEAIAFDVKDMPAAGKVKIGHVGSWAIRKVLNKSRKHVEANIYSKIMQTMATVRQHLLTNFTFIPGPTNLLFPN